MLLKRLLGHFCQRWEVLGKLPEILDVFSNLSHDKNSTTFLSEKVGRYLMSLRYWYCDIALVIFTF